MQIFVNFGDFFVKSKSKMAPSRKELRESIATFYQLHHTKGKAFTYNQFKKSLPRPTIYRIFAQIDETGDIARKKGSGRPEVLSQSEKTKLKKMVNNKTGVSQRKLGRTFQVDHKTISNHIKRLGIKVRKRKRAPKQTPEQVQRQDQRLQNLIQTSFSEDSQCEIVMDDESYFTLDGTGMPGNDIFYTKDITKTPNDVKFRRQAKFPTKIMVWGVISKRREMKILHFLILLSK